MADKLPAIQGYRSLLVDLFQRLLSNGLKFQPEGQVPYITITICNVVGQDIPESNAPLEDAYCCISFIDNGIGFDQEYAELIFGMFQKLQKEPFKGSGMGLAICRKILDLHHGFIRAEGTPGKGSTFKCYFPIKNTGN